MYLPGPKCENDYKILKTILPGTRVLSTIFYRILSYVFQLKWRSSIKQVMLKRIHNFATVARYFS